jgi:RNase adapter protein RapZ
LREVRSIADLVVDSSAFNIHQLEKKIEEIFKSAGDDDLRVNVLSFGYKYGIPVDADLVMDCRFIANPHWVPELRPLNGLDAPVSEAVLGSANTQEFLDRYQALFETMAVGFFAEGRKYLTLAIGCTGGKHRSVAIAEELSKRLNAKSHIGGGSIVAHPVHRDLGREI